MQSSAYITPQALYRKGRSTQMPPIPSSSCASQFCVHVPPREPLPVRVCHAASDSPDLPCWLYLAFGPRAFGASATHCTAGTHALACSCTWAKQSKEPLFRWRSPVEGRPGAVVACGVLRTASVCAHQPFAQTRVLVLNSVRGTPDHNPVVSCRALYHSRHNSAPPSIFRADGGARARGGGGDRHL